MGARMIIVSNRVAVPDTRPPLAGGLAAGVLDALKQQGGIWFGWSGEITDEAAAGRACRANGRSIYALHGRSLPATTTDYYTGFANGALWPTLHYQVGHAHFSRADAPATGA